MQDQRFNEFRDRLIAYLETEKQILEEEIQNNALLSREEKIAVGLLIPDAELIRLNEAEREYEFAVTLNNSKLRPGDKIILSCKGTEKTYKGKVLENSFDLVTLHIPYGTYEAGMIFDIVVVECVYTESIIRLASTIQRGSPGAFLLEILTGMAEPTYHESSAINEVKAQNVIAKLNRKGALDARQAMFCKEAFRRPSVYCLQGPPGTGKTDVLATVAAVFSRCGKEVLLVARTHHAVNNALREIRRQDKGVPLVKNGESIKSQELSNIRCATTYKQYARMKSGTRAHHGDPGDIIGMTFHGAVSNLGLRPTGFLPLIVLVDEASQIPFVYGALLGMLGCGSIILIGDDRQLPPIFHERLQEHEYSRSIFSYVKEMYPQNSGYLDVTYRMNGELAEFVSHNFYEPSVKIVPSEISKDRKLSLNSEAADQMIRKVLNADQSLFLIDVTLSLGCDDENNEEAEWTAQLVEEANRCKLGLARMAVITPYRRQVKCIRSHMLKRGMTRLPLIDTVERLQGQSVDMLIVSMCISRPQFLQHEEAFIFNRQRLNVMFSRATTKVVILASQTVADRLKEEVSGLENVAEECKKMLKTSSKCML